LSKKEIKKERKKERKKEERKKERKKERNPFPSLPSHRSGMAYFPLNHVNNVYLRNYNK